MGEIMKKNTNKKTSKKLAPVKQTQTCPIDCCSTGHKIWSAVALAGLFACGLILGLSYGDGGMPRQTLDNEQCDAIANEIVNMTSSGVTVENIDTLNELKDSYLNGCAGRLVIIEKSAVVSESENPEIMSTCSRIEYLLKKRLHSEDSANYIDHLANADTYSSMADRGCQENSDLYKTLALRELEIATALQPTDNMRQRDAAIVIDTFKKLDMEREAQEFLDKVEKLIDPATDFILKMEQIINE